MIRWITLLMLLLPLQACSMATVGDGVNTALDAVAEIAKPSLDIVRTACTVGEWKIVARTESTKEQDEADLARLRNECDRLYNLFDAWAGIDGVTRRLLEAGKIDDVLETLVDVKRAAWAVRDAVHGSYVVRGMNQ